jgi:hypothetical protein
MERQGSIRQAVVKGVSMTPDVFESSPVLWAVVVFLIVRDVCFSLNKHFEVHRYDRDEKRAQTIAEHPILQMPRKKAS